MTNNPEVPLCTRDRDVHTTEVIKETNAAYRRSAYTREDHDVLFSTLERVYSVDLQDVLPPGLVICYRVQLSLKKRAQHLHLLLVGCDDSNAALKMLQGLLLTSEPKCGRDKRQTLLK